MWELDRKESWEPKNWCIWTVVLEKTLECPLDQKEIKPANPKGNWTWIFIGNTDAEADVANILAAWCKGLTHCKRPWCWERLKAGGEGDDRGWDGWMASLVQWPLVWASSGSWWRTGNPGVLQSMGITKKLDATEWLNNDNNLFISYCEMLGVLYISHPFSRYVTCK